MAILVAINTSLDNLVFIKVIAYPYSCNFIYFSEDSSKFFLIIFFTKVFLVV